MALNILVVDDSLVMRSMIIKTVKMSGLDIGDAFQAENGQEALDVLRQNWIDLVFLDVNMPVMNGEETMEHLRQEDMWQEMPVIVVSTEGSQTRIERLKAMGADFVRKPFTPENIRDIIAGKLGISDEQHFSDVV